MQLQLFHLSYEPLFEDIQLTLDDPGIYLLYGKSGCGKTTLLHLISKIIDPDQGEILINGNSVMNRFTFDSTVFYTELMTIGFQNAYLIDDYKLEDYLQLYGFKKEEIVSILTRLDLLDVLHLKIGKLSLGQRQRAALALIALIHPSIILLDEPTASLDIRHIEICKELFMELAQNSIVLIASHQLDFYKPICDQLLQIENHRIKITSNHTALKKNTSLLKSGRQNSHFHISVFSLHLKNNLSLDLQMIFTLFFILSISLFFYWLLDSAQTFVSNYALHYPDLYVLEVSNTTVEELIEIGGYDSLLIENLEENYTCSLWSSPAVLLNGKEPEKGEVVITKDLDNAIHDSIRIGEKSYIVSGILDNDFNNNTIYFLEDDYFEANDYGHYLITFENLKEMMKSKALYEKKYISVENSYLSMCESVESIIQGIRFYTFLILLFAMSFVMIILTILLKTLFSRYTQEILDFYLHGISLVQERILYISEAVTILMISLIAAFGIMRLAENNIVNYIRNNYTSLSILLPFEKFLLKNSLVFILSIAVLVLISIMVELGMFHHYFHYSISKRVKEDEGC